MNSQNALYFKANLGSSTWCILEQYKLWPCCGFHQSDIFLSERRTLSEIYIGCRSQCKNNEFEWLMEEENGTVPEPCNIIKEDWFIIYSVWDLSACDKNVI